MTFWTNCPKISVFAAKNYCTLWGDDRLDHSLYGYLKRRSTEELESLLAYCLKEENYKIYQCAVLEIQSVLEERLKPGVQQAQEKPLRERRQD